MNFQKIKKNDLVKMYKKLQADNEVNLNTIKHLEVSSNDLSKECKRLSEYNQRLENAAENNLPIALVSFLKENKIKSYKGKDFEFQFSDQAFFDYEGFNSDQNFFDQTNLTDEEKKALEELEAKKEEELLFHSSTL